MLVAVCKYIFGCSGGGLQEIRRENSKIVNGWLCSDGRFLSLRDGQGVWVFRGCGYWHVGDGRVLSLRDGQGVWVFRGCGYWHVGDAR